MKTKKIASLVLLTALTLPLATFGQQSQNYQNRGRIYRTTVQLRSYKEIPANRSRAVGFARVTLDTRTNTLRYALSFRGLTSTETEAHIHGLANTRQNAPVLHPIALGSPVSGVWHYNRNLERGILNGRTYFNVHSQRYPNGEIRGQIFFR